MRTRSAALLTVLATACAVPAEAVAAPTLAPNYPCYTDEESVLLTGAGFSPNGEVRLSSSGARLATIDSDSDGEFSMRLSVPAIDGALTLPLVATDSADPRLSARTAVRVVSVGVEVVPSIGASWRIVARGFIGTRALYAHVRRRGAPGRRNVDLGAPRGACGTLDVTRRLFRRVPRPGAYTLQFDSNRRYVPNIAPSVTYSMTVARLP
ncbi:MAG TPA: hypothetical protein VHF90_01930 [Thermoleophilaceae bacterium]|nr:hypothetical protein [Thermoleophilaceae bacterium]